MLRKLRLTQKNGFLIKKHVYTFKLQFSNLIQLLSNQL